MAAAARTRPVLLAARPRPCTSTPFHAPSLAPRARRRALHSAPRPPAPPFAFAFDIDGVLLRSSAAIPGARSALTQLQRLGVPFILLTNGGGRSEADRVAELERALDVRLDVRMFVQSHTPFTQLVDEPAGGGGTLRDACVLVVGGEGQRCRRVAESYGYANAVTTSDIYTADPAIWPFSAPFAAYHAEHAQPLPLPLYPGAAAAQAPLQEHLRVAAVHVYNDPRDWGLDLAVLMDLLLSRGGYLGTRSALNGTPALPNAGYLQDGQPPVVFGNPDLWWPAAHHVLRLGQGGFRAALEGAWAAAVREAAEATGGTAAASLEPAVRMMGKPHAPTYAFAESVLVAGRARMFGSPAEGAGGLRRVYMVGDNPASDIAGANAWDGRGAARWRSVLVRSGVYGGGRPAHEPAAVVDDVAAAVKWALAEEAWGADRH